MSNPAVITLSKASSRKGKFKRFVIEDNIGESVHLHIDSMRFDFTINEYLEFSKVVKKSLKELKILKEYDIENFDEHFLLNCSNFLPNLHNISIEEIKLSDLKFIIHSNYKKDMNIIKLKKITESPVYKYLKGKKKDFLNYNQYNYFRVGNEKRILDVFDSIKSHGYPYQNQYIVLFNGENVVRDGQHRAAVLAHLYGLNYKAKILRFNFNGNTHLLKPNIKNLKNIFLFLVKKIYKKIKSKLK
jgi:hypothetical protein